MRIRTRNHLIKFIEDHPPSPGILKAVMHTNINLGGFWKLPVKQMGGWIVQVVTPLTRQTHHVVVQPDDRTKLGYRIWLLLDPIPWEYYDGDNSRNPLYQGDCPIYYKDRKEHAKTKNKRSNKTRPSTTITTRPDRSTPQKGDHS
ncbi:hypothetical protein LCGC14_2629050 [marine sediment metagenome]|uniref:Uncharacterized protein n=1 Tax=marine sediment metagenome TaxID=412755 RepID=A0A0F9CBT5_9ZZZZ